MSSQWQGGSWSLAPVPRHRQVHGWLVICSAEAAAGPPPRRVTVISTHNHANIFHSSGALKRNLDLIALEVSGCFSLGASERYTATTLFWQLYNTNHKYSFSSKIT